MSDLVSPNVRLHSKNKPGGLDRYGSINPFNELLLKEPQGVSDNVSSYMKNDSYKGTIGEAMLRHFCLVVLFLVQGNK